MERLPKINSLIKQEISKIIERYFKIKDTFLTITNVETSPDLRNAKIWISVFPPAKEEEALMHLSENASQIQKMLNKKLVMKYVPKISFKIDKTAQKASRVENLLKEINNPE